MTQTELKNLKKLSVVARMDILDMVYSAQSGHPGGSLSATEILVYLYFKQMNIDPNNPKWEKRDRLVLSKGHVTPILYSCLARKGYFPKEELLNFRKYGSILQGHPDMKNIPGVDMSTGSLGQGLSCAVGMAYAGKKEKNQFNVYAIVGDGETQEGQIWEALMFAGNHKLNNLCVIIDYNHIQICGFVEDVNNPAPLDKKLEAFGFDVAIADGHDFESLESAFNKFKTTDKPLAIIAETIKGKGVSFMENSANWHGKAPNKELYDKAIEELKMTKKQLEEAE